MVQLEASVRRELRTLARFIGVYCDGHHSQEPRQPATMLTHDVAEIAGKDVVLCQQCTRLLVHAFTKRTHCPMDPKPMCKKCPNHCYAPVYRQQIREVMKYSGIKLLLRGRVDYLLHLVM